ncbi:SRPBCC family protein [Bradyrhizobium sp. Pear76]|uniref:SRPBCC family protein n=1 Tax=Bradyrhizobium oropedii TaxID=1571201 RepID=UPI001E325F5A|nr:SRPBCC family protein [Bradyrhizobium oropedii]MCC8964583.1 SRPBCC family protein [Bradyrhizobium oropedii]
MPKPEFVYVTYIETTPEKLWDALTSSEFTQQYWFDTELRSNWTVGAPVALVMNGKVTDTGEILEFDRPRRLAYTFKHEADPEMRKEPATKVVLTLEPFGSVVKLTVTHDGFGVGSKLFEGISNGWPVILSGLKSLLETGKVFRIAPETLGLDCA